MSKARYFVRVDTFWQNSPDSWFGPYATRAAAQAAVDASDAAKPGRMARDVKEQTRVVGIYSATESAKAGRSHENTYGTGDGIPSTSDELREIEESYQL